jgi:hypothetical protein
MVNDPLPGQLTVETLLEHLKHAHRGAVVGLSIPAGFAGDPALQTFANLRVARISSAIITLTINSQLDEEPPPPTCFAPK